MLKMKRITTYYSIHRFRKDFRPGIHSNSYRYMQYNHMLYQYICKTEFYIACILAGPGLARLTVLES